MAEDDAQVHELLAEADRLFGLPPGEFTPARDSRARELKGSALAAPVKALRKPSLAAWVVNLLVRRDSGQVDQVLAVGEALREAQATMSGEELRALTRQRRQLTAAVTTRARALAAENGQRVTSAVAEQVEATLTAAMLDPSCARALRSGLLVTALSATGVDAVELDRAVALPGALGFTATAHEEPVAARPDLRVVPDPEADQKALAAARASLGEADEGVAAARESLDAATGEVGELEARALQVQSEIDELRRRVAELEASYEEVDDELGDAEDARAEAEQALAEATRARDAAARALARLES